MAASSVLMSLLPALAEGAGAHAATAASGGAVAHGSEVLSGWVAVTTGWIIGLPAVSALLCGLCAAMKVRSKLPAWITVILLGLSFAFTLLLYANYEPPARVVHLFDWFNLHWGAGEYARSFIANFSLYVDSLTLLWMLFVTGLGTLIALYASEYMEVDVGRGYARFFGGVSIFLFAMSCLVMGDNLLLLYLGWEGVGLASYLLIGYYHHKPSAVAAAKKAFIMNRIGDLGLALAIYFIWQHFGTIRYAELFALGPFTESMGDMVAGGWQLKAIPFLLMLGAFGKSAQGPLFVWLPDAMEGPTPVSALIHAATMVTAGVYLLARMFPVMSLHEYALPTVAWVGGITAIVSATIGMAQYDIKRIMAYSTVSQLGYMFVGIGVMTTFGAAYHVFTHAFFKAVLFLTCGAIMHGFAGQLDLRKVSGLRHMTGWKVTAYTMLIGCLCLAGFPGTSGYFSKDAILGQIFVDQHFGFAWLGWLLVFTAGLTAYYTFRVWFRVCAGPVAFEMGDDHHGAADDHGHDEDHGHAHGPAKPQAGHGGHSHHGHGQPHPPKTAINFVLLIITVGALLAAVPYFVPEYGNGWVQRMVADSSAAGGVPVEHHGDAHAESHGTLLGYDPHQAMYVVSSVVGLTGLLIALVLHLTNRGLADSLKASLHGFAPTRIIARAMENKWYVDELYHLTVRLPLWILGHVLYAFDRYVLDLGLVDGVAKLPRTLARSFQPLQNGVVQSYAVSMAGGVALVAMLVVYMPELRHWMSSLLSGSGGGG